MQVSNERIAIFIGLLSMVFSMAYNEWNIAYLEIAHPEKVSEAGTVITSDDASYLVPPQNWLEGKGWKDNSLGIRSFFLRSPGYGLWFSPFLIAAGEVNGMVVMKYFQILLFALSAHCLFYLLVWIAKRRWLAVTGAVIYGITPFASGFLYYTLTEAISPALVILTTYALYKARNGLHSEKIRWYFASALVLAFLVLVRPILLPFLILPLIFIWAENFSRKRATLLIGITLLIMGSPSLAWQIRNYSVAGEITGLHPIYYPHSNSEFRPTHEAAWGFARSFGMSGQEFHELMVPMWESAIQSDTAWYYFEEFRKRVPPFVVEAVGEEKLDSALLAYHTATVYQRYYYARNYAMPREIPSIELDAMKLFNEMESLVRNHHGLYSEVGVPMMVLAEMSMHSNLNMHIFQNTYRGNWLMEVVRWLFAFIHLSCFVAMCYTVVFIQDWRERWLLVILPLGYVLFLAFVIRGIEERYTLPMLPLMLIGLLWAVNDVMVKWNRYKQKEGAL